MTMTPEERTELRDRFAGVALQGFVMQSHTGVFGQNTDGAREMECAVKAYAVADAMLAARDLPEGRLHAQLPEIVKKLQDLFRW